MIETLDPVKELVEETGGNRFLADLGWPATVMLIFLGNEDGVDKYACVNVTPNPQADPTFAVNCLAAFIDEEEAMIYKIKYNMSGTIVNKTFEEARQIAISKPIIIAIAIQRNGTSYDLHYVR